VQGKKKKRLRRVSGKRGKVIIRKEKKKSKKKSKERNITDK